MEITAAVLRDKDQPYQLEQLTLEALRSDEVLVRLVGTGMCHTDVLPRGEVSVSPPPMVAGHEGAGVVEAVGDEVQALAVGDHVVLTFDFCGTCDACGRGTPSYCETFLMRNMTARRLDFSAGATDAAGAAVTTRWFGQSSFATYCVATARNAVKVDPALPLEQLGPLGCGIQTGAGSVLVALDVQPGDTVAVIGVGAVGLAAIMAAKVAGASSIVAADLHQHRLDLAQELGATHGIISGGDLVAQIHAAVPGGVHHVIDTTGVPAVMEAALMAARMGGKIGYVGVQTGDVNVNPIAIIGKTVIGILEGSVDPHTFIPRMIELWQEGRFPFDRLIETFPLAQINEAEQASLSGRVIKPVLLPG